MISSTFFFRQDGTTEINSFFCTYLSCPRSLYVASRAISTFHVMPPTFDIAKIKKPSRVKFRELGMYTAPLCHGNKSLRAEPCPRLVLITVTSLAFDPPPLCRNGLSPRHHLRQGFCHRLHTPVSTLSSLW